MTSPRLEIRLEQIGHNARTLVERLAPLGISVTGVTKATLGSPEVAGELLRAGVTSIGESRIENIEALRRAGVTSPVWLIRSPMPSQAARVVAGADVSLNSELEVIRLLSQAATTQGRRHGVVLMVELGDLREGVLPADLDALAERAGALTNIDVVGIGTNLACQSGVVPDARNMGELSALADRVEQRAGSPLSVVSGGNSSNLDWVFAAPAVGRINHLRLGEAILLGVEPLGRTPIAGLHTDAITLVCEVIESGMKPRRPTGRIGQAAFGSVPGGPGEEDHPCGRDRARRTIMAIGHQDVDPAGLIAPNGMTILGASSDHLVLDPGSAVPAVGSELRFGLNYGALVRAMTSPFVARVITGRTGSRTRRADPSPERR